MKSIDLRSDTVTLPTPAMRRAMAEAEVGDDVFGEDPTVNRLQAMAAELVGMEAALFVTSGTQANLLALLSHCGLGDEYIAGRSAHLYRWEGGGSAVFGGIQPQPIDFESDGTLDLATVEASINPEDDHFARTRLLCLENTQAGKALPLRYLPLAAEVAKAHSLCFHLDGARLFNAATALNSPVNAITRHFDTISFCLSKGLGAPVGSLLCGTAELIAKARRWRKVAGGGMRQAGILAAAGIFALQNNVERLEEDHENAQRLAEGLEGLTGLSVDAGGAQTNMVFVTIGPEDAKALQLNLKEHGILIREGERLRLVTHLGITAEDIEKVVTYFRRYFSGRGNR